MGLTLEVLAALVDVDLRAVLRVVPVKEFQDPLGLLVDLPLSGAMRASSAVGRFD